MLVTEANEAATERQDDFLALINMLGYAEGVTETMGVTTAAIYIGLAKQALKRGLQDEMGNAISSDDIVHLASARSGRC